MVTTSLLYFCVFLKPWYRYASKEVDMSSDGRFHLSFFIILDVLIIIWRMQRLPVNILGGPEPDEVPPPH